MTTALAIVAHFDDHALWMGGIMHVLKDWQWTAVAMCVELPERRSYFCDFCAEVRAQGYPMDCRDYQNRKDPSVARPNTQEEMQGKLLRCFSGNRFDWVFTHSRDAGGEYGGHDNHTEVRDAVLALARAGHFVADEGKVATFSYGVIGGVAATARIDPESAKRTTYLQLTYKELGWKLSWCNRIPDMGSLRNLACPCPNPEAFVCEGMRPEDHLPPYFKDQKLREPV